MGGNMNQQKVVLPVARVRIWEAEKMNPVMEPDL
jgi:hypothetical protein